MSLHVCDCGQRYESLAALEACAASGHAAAAANELADALADLPPDERFVDADVPRGTR